ncbi:DEAD/DEAH box helicase [Alkalihalobacillus pseudalcaliphilus]|uniref:DEAD/DEAH box helicase n=1 Tax=Alkalihalobacillus pseudalcaliphilus TaxID=79884 RepID=UPI00064DF2DD|nr:DEAD/DEAH box helicase [Alkalihalobacillus pseudalcaliphilus]KMK75973.1 DEAD/DEAH box helicase [Alkalihalobacillus pseudalcaliphilus]
MSMNNFKRFDLKPYLMDALNEQRITMPTEIQERLIPAIRNKRDVMGQSQTGTGKTFAFLLPILDMIDESKDELQVILTAPTRELASQLFEEVKKLIEHAPEENAVKAKLLVGGTDKLRAIESLKQAPHIVVGTPGRIRDLVNEQALQVYTATTLIVDEADQMLDMGFIEDVDYVAARMAPELQMLVFSATIPEKLKPFLNKYMDNPKHVQVEPKHVTASTIEHRLVALRHRDKLDFVADLASSLNPYFAIIFASTKEEADEVTKALISKGLNVGCLHGGLKPRERKQVMRQVIELKFQFLVATDLAARGIDIKGVSHIINYSLPNDLDFYIHRVGRTGRAGADGIAYTIYDLSDQQKVEKLIQKGITFTYYDFKNGDWKQLDKPPIGMPGKRVNKRQPEKTKTEPKRKQDVANTGGKAKAKPKKVKPAYKKKARFKQAKEEQRQRRVKNKKK